MTGVLHGEQLRARFNALDDFLLAHQRLWRPRPFTHRQLPWERDHPELATWLRSRSLADAEVAHNWPQRLDAPAPFNALAVTSSALSDVGHLPVVTLESVSARRRSDVPGRKWQQIDAFASCLAFQRLPTHWLDWCAGKGHLGRRLTQPDQQLTCLEQDPQLIDAGSQLSLRLGINAQHLQHDVLSADTAEFLHPAHTLVALHACGDLHVQLIRLAAYAGCTQLAIAPCCYNRISTADYQALSAAGKASALKLSLEDLNLPLSETVTAGAKVRRQRDVSMARRLGFDLLQRQLRDIDDYLPTPSLPSAWLQRPFNDYCRHLAELKGLPPIGRQNWPALEAAAWKRLAEVRNLELLRGLFRRPLELWLVLDRALYLHDHGYAVQLGVFCENNVTPRNLLLLAER